MDYMIDKRIFPKKNPKALKRFKPKKANAFTRGKRQVNMRAANVTSTPARTPDGETIGEKPMDPFSRLARLNRTESRYNSTLMGLGLGAVGGSAVGAGVDRVKNGKIDKRLKVKNPNVHRITDLGSAAERDQTARVRYAAKKRPYMSGKSMAVGAGVGTPIGVWGGYEGRQVAREQTKYDKQYQVKKDYDPKKGFSQQGLAFSDKEGRKRVSREYNARYNADMKNFRRKHRKQTATEVAAGTGLGGAAGAGLGAKYGQLSTKGKSAAAAGALGAAIGATYGTVPSSVRQVKYSTKAIPDAQKKAVASGLKSGDIKRTKNKVGGWSGLEKSASVSAFGVDHG